jgi:glucose-6-phosphate 1-dehydrogenase
VETYVAVRLALDSWRWAGVPMLIRAGKTMPVTATEVAITFRPPPYAVFGQHAKISNQLRFRIWPETEIGVALAGKKPGAGAEAQLQELTFAQPRVGHAALRPVDRSRPAGQAAAVR